MRKTSAPCPHPSGVIQNEVDRGLTDGRCVQPEDCLENSLGPRFSPELAESSAHAAQNATIPFAMTWGCLFAQDIAAWSFRHGPIPFGRVSVSEEFAPGEISRFDTSKGEILLNRVVLSQGAAMYDTPEHSGDAIELRNKILASLLAQSFLLDLHNNERLFSRDGPLGDANRFAISPFSYDAARNDPLLAKRIASSLESVEIEEKNHSQVSLTPAEWLRGVYHAFRSFLSRSHEKDCYRQEYRRLDTETETLLMGKLLNELTGLSTPMNRGGVLRSLGPELSFYIESACRDYAVKHQLPQYHGPAIDFLLAARLGNGALLSGILESEGPDGRSLHRFMLESRSEFGRYPDHYVSLIKPLEEPETWRTPVRVAVCGVGMNEEPITLAVMLSECAVKNGVDDPDFEVHVLSEGGSVLTRLQHDGMYPFPYSPADVYRGLQKVFPEGADRIVEKYFQKVNGYLVPCDELRAKIHYHKFKIGQDCDAPQSLQGQCTFLTIHNVLQYIGKDGKGEAVDGACVAASFGALKSLVRQGGEVSVKTSASVDPEVKRQLHLLQ